MKKESFWVKFIQTITPPFCLAVLIHSLEHCQKSNFDAEH